MKRLIPVLLMACALSGCTHKQPEIGDVLNERAQLSALPYPVLSWTALTTSVDRGQGTMSTLFGNSAAIAAARSGQASYPQGAVLGLVTWKQREDPHWFGARIPDAPQEVELVEFSAEGARYRSFTGAPLTEQAVAPAPDRVAVIMGMKALQLP